MLPNCKLKSKVKGKTEKCNLGNHRGIEDALRTRRHSLTTVAVRCRLSSDRKAARAAVLDRRFAHALFEVWGFRRTEHEDRKTDVRTRFAIPSEKIPQLAPMRAVGHWQSESSRRAVDLRVKWHDPEPRLSVCYAMNACGTGGGPGDPAATSSG